MIRVTSMPKKEWFMPIYVEGALRLSWSIAKALQTPENAHRRRAKRLCSGTDGSNSRVAGMIIDRLASHINRVDGRGGRIPSANAISRL